MQILGRFLPKCQRKHFSNRVEATKFLDKIIVPYTKKERESKSLGSDQKPLAIFDVFQGQMTDEVLDILAKNHIFTTTVPGNMTKFYQP